MIERRIYHTFLHSYVFCVIINTNFVLTSSNKEKRSYGTGIFSNMLKGK